MKKFVIFSAAWFVVVMMAVAAEFPYDAGMTVRHETNAAEVASFESPVEIPAVNGGMPMADSVATLYAAVVDFCASDETNWALGTNAVGVAQVALTMKRTGGVCAWMGYTDGAWKEFAAAGVVAQEGEWQIKVDVDYTFVPALIRYSVRKPGASDYVALLNGGNAWVPIGTTAGSQKINHVMLYGAGETGLVQAKSGAREASAGSVTAANVLTLASTNLVVTVNATDAWGVNAAKVVINGQEKTASLVDGVAQVDVSDCIAMGEDYTYDVSLVGSYRGKDLSVAGGSKAVFIGNTDTWFAYENGTFTNAAADANLSTAGNVLSAAAVSPRGCVNPIEAIPSDPVALDLVSTLAVAGAVRESALTGLDASSAKAALTVVRFTDGSRGWAVRTADGWKKLAGEGISANNGTYTVRMSFDYRHGETNVTYAIKNASEVFVTLEDADHETSFAAGDALVAKASLLGGTVSSLVATCKSVPKAADPTPVVDPSKGETTVEVKAADAMAAGAVAKAAIVVPAAAGDTPEAQAAYRSCFKVASSTEVVGKPGSYTVVLALDETVVQADEVTKDVAAELDGIAAAFAAGSESGPITLAAKNLRPGLWYSIASSAAVGFAADTEGERVQATGGDIEIKATKPGDVENACFFRVLVNAADKKF